jgi:hypothetical protein
MGAVLCAGGSLQEQEHKRITTTSWPPLALVIAGCGVKTL